MANESKLCSPHNDRLLGAVFLCADLLWNRAKITHPISQPGSKWWLMTTEQCSRLRPMHNVLPNLSTANSHGRRRSSLHDLRGMIEHRTSKNGHSFNRTWHARRKLPLPDASRSPLFF